MPDPKILSAQQVADLLHIEVSTVRKHAANGTLGIRAMHIGKQWKFLEDDVYEYIYGPKWKEIVGQTNEKC